MKEAIDKMIKYKLGSICVLDNNSKLFGILTDGDIRRKIVFDQKPFSALMVDDVEKHCTRNPISIKNLNTPIRNIIKLMTKKIWDLPVTDKQKRLVGILHLHLLVKNLIK